MTELQQKEFEILSEVVGICNELNIKYYLVCGSALGAVKYNGFIPWDDDIDIGMFRNEYEKFLSEAPKYLSDKLFLQSYNTEKNYTHIFAKVRNTETTYLEKTVAHINMNHGIYIDVFPLDGYPKNKRKQEKLEILKRIYMKLLSCNYKCERNMIDALIVKMLRMIGVHRRSGFILNRYNKLISQYDVENSEMICNHGNWQGKLEYAPKWQYGDGIWMKFEGLQVRVPECYDEYLTQKYGDWRADLPKSEQVGHHYYLVCDVNESYIKVKQDMCRTNLFHIK